MPDEDATPTAVAPLPGDVAQQRLSPRAVVYWRIELATVALPLAAVVTALLALAPFGLGDVAGGLRIAVVVAAWVVAIGTIVVVPPIRRRIWWYAIGDEEVDLHHGFVVVTRTVVPMVRVQHVDLHRGPIADRLRLATIELHTAAGSLKIPALDRDEAERIRLQVAELARVPDDL